MGPHNGVPATRASRGAPRGDDRMANDAWVRFAKMRGDDLKQPALPRSRSAFLRPGFCIVASLTRIEEWAERRETFGCSAEHPWGVSCASKTRVNALMTRY